MGCAGLARVHGAITTLETLETINELLHGAQQAQEQPDAEPTLDALDLYVESLNKQLKIHEQTIADLNGLFDQERESARKLANVRADYESKLAAIEARIEALTGLRDELADTLSRLVLRQLETAGA